MGDFEDDSYIRTRDKFRRERSDADNRREKRDFFDNRAGGGHSNRPDRRPSEYRGYAAPRERSSFGTELPSKRPRREWNDDRHLTARVKETRKEPEDEMNYRPPLLPFKRFVDPLDDSITDEEAVARYKEYKEAFNKRYIEEFFEAHKNEEWLREKYHPDFIDDTREQIAKNIRQRLDVFLDLFDKGIIDNQSVDVDNTKNLVKLMDAVVIKLNGGTDEDLTMLEDSNVMENILQKMTQGGPKSEGEESDVFSDEDTGARESAKKPDSLTKPADSKTDEAVVNKDWTGVSSESETEGRPKLEEVINEEEEDYGADTKESDNDDEHASVLATNEKEESEDTNGVKMEEGADSIDPTYECPLSAEVCPKNNSKRLSPRHNLCKTASIFFRSLPPTIARKDMEDICSAQPGFIRLAFYDPVPERRFTRHAWATYEPDVNIKKICWALNTNPVLREKWQQGSDSNDVCATVNRDLAQRIRPVSAALTHHRPVMRNDLRIASRLVAQLDAKHNLWPLPGEDEAGNVVTNACSVPGLPGVFSANPLMRNLKDFLIDNTASKEEEETGSAILSRSSSKGIEDGDVDKTASSVPIDTDHSLLRALDRIIIYLRIVYSIDYYAAALYQSEDLMPHRCGILHARGALNSGGGGSSTTVTQCEVNNYINTFNEKIKTLLDVPRDLTDEEIGALGARDPENAAEEFIEANIQKRTSKKKPSKVVWVCPLSDKKFREPVFVRKHILNKHMDKVEAAKKDNAIFFNNFLRDPKRPSLPEAPRHLINRFYPSPTAGPVGDMTAMRGRNLGGHRGFGGGYRGSNRNNPLPYGRREYPAGQNAMVTNFYDIANPADVFVFTGRGGGGRGGNQRGGAGFKDYNSDEILNYGPHFAPSKSEVCSQSWQGAAPALTLAGNSLDIIDHFVYLGSCVIIDGTIRNEIALRIQKARSAFTNLKHLWRRHDVSLPLKGRVYKSTILAVLLYGREYWPLRAEDLCRLSVFDSHCLRSIARVRWEHHITNDAVSQRIFGADSLNLKQTISLIRLR